MTAVAKASLPRRNFHGRPVTPMTHRQRAARRAVLERFSSGVWPLEQVDCPVCGGRPAVQVAGRDRQSLPMSTVVCGSCGSLFTSPRPTATSLKAYYDELAYELDRGSIPHETYFELEREKGREIVKLVENVAGRDALDGLVAEIGAGAGGVLAAFRDAGLDTIGCDISEDQFAVGRSRGLDLRLGDLTSLLGEVDARRVSLVVYEQVLEHLPDPGAELRQLRAALDAGTLLYVGVPGIRHVDVHYGSDLVRYLEFDHLVHFELTSLNRLVDPVGFEPLHGDERVRALFRAGAPGRAGDFLGPDRTLRFLGEMEARRAARARRTAPRRALGWIAAKPRAAVALVHELREQRS